ncbi:hypothetical protein Q3G72_004585 [Acer saccharum]|nr:hypothetical protein Q3G72_004585 [Acer saccharum]
MDLSPPFTVIEGGLNKDNLLAMENENSDDLNSIRQMTLGKPSRHLSAIRLCVSSIRLAAAADLCSAVCTQLQLPCLLGSTIWIFETFYGNLNIS